MNFNLDTTLGTLLDHPQAKPILEKYVPGVSTNPMVSMIRNMSINNILAMPQAAQLGITKEKADKLLAEVNARVKTVGGPA
jgi:hypothetical protein